MRGVAGATEDPHPCIFNTLRCQTILKAATDTKRVLAKLPNLVAAQAIAKRRSLGADARM